MTNKDYKRLTDTGIPAITSDDVYNRLYELENAIEDGTLLFLPCKVGDEFWWILNSCDRHILRSETVASIEIYEDGKIYVTDNSHHFWAINDGKIYFSKEEAEKALEELTK